MSKGVKTDKVPSGSPLFSTWTASRSPGGRGGVGGGKMKGGDRAEDVTWGSPPLSTGRAPESRGGGGGGGGEDDEG